MIGSSAVWATLAAGLYCVDLLCREVGLRLGFDELALPCVVFDFEAVDLVVLALLDVLVFVANASEEKTERAANEARKSRRFKYFLRQRQPAAETKRPCHRHGPLN